MHLKSVIPENQKPKSLTGKLILALVEDRVRERSDVECQLRPGAEILYYLLSAVKKKTVAHKIVLNYAGVKNALNLAWEVLCYHKARLRTSKKKKKQHQKEASKAHTSWHCVISPRGVG